MKRPKIPAAEMEVLACLHKLSQATAAELREAIRGYRPMSHGSMATLLKRLQAKGLVRREKGQVGKAFVYAPVRRHGHTFRNVIRDLVQRIFHGDSAALVASLFETKPPTREELDRIQQMLDKLRRASPNDVGGSK
jgi:BlaI family penicillinase repressor